MASSDPISPTTSPSGCAESRSCMMRSRGSVPMAENMSAKRVIWSASYFVVAISIFLLLSKYSALSSRPVLLGAFPLGDEASGNILQRECPDDVRRSAATDDGRLRETMASQHQQGKIERLIGKQ